MSKLDRQPWNVRLVMAFHRAVATVWTVGRKVGEFVESFVARLVSGIFTAGELTENVEVGLRTLGRWALAPWHLACRLLGGGVSSSLHHTPWRAAKALRSHLISPVFKLATELARLVSRPLLWPVRHATWPLWRPAASLLGFIRAWTLSRSVPQVLWGLPALLMLLPVAGLAFVRPPSHEGTRVAEYRAALAIANQQGDVVRAGLYERKLAQLGVNTDHQAYQHALELAASGRHDEAYRAMQQLAPVDRCGYGPAHYWIARGAFAAELGDPSQREALVDGHLARLKELGQEHTATRLLKGLRLAERGELEAAAQVLEPLSGEVPVAAATLLRLDLQLRRDEQTRRDAASVVRHLRQQRAEGKLSGSADYFLLSVALQIVGAADMEREDLLAEWCERYPRDPQATRELLKWVEAKFERLLGASGSSPLELARLLERAARLGTHASWLDNQFERLYALRDKSVVANPLPEQVVALLLANQATPPAVLSSLGVQAARTAEWERAEACFRRVTTGDPANAVVWNNLAWVILQQGNPARLEEARRLVDRAIELEPRAYRFRETRGQIWLRLGEWERARADLEFARSGMPSTPSLEESLASVYAALGGQRPEALHTAPPKRQ